MLWCDEAFYGRDTTCSFVSFHDLVINTGVKDNHKFCLLRKWAILPNYPLAQKSCGGDIGSVPYVCM